MTCVALVVSSACRSRESSLPLITEEQREQIRNEDIIHIDRSEPYRNYAKRLKTERQRLGRWPSMEELYEGSQGRPPSGFMYFGKRPDARWMYALDEGGQGTTDRIGLYDDEDRRVGQVVLSRHQPENPVLLFRTFGLGPEHTPTRRKAALDRAASYLSTNITQQPASAPKRP